MPDYNIYIRASGVMEAPSTRAWSGGESQTSSADFMGSAREVLSVAENPDSIIGKSGAFIKKIIPAKAVAAVAVAAMVVSIADKAMSACLDFQTLTTGDYLASTAYKNTKTAIHNFFTPISSGINALKAQTSIAIEDSRRAKYRELLGDSAINQLTGVGV